MPRFSATSADPNPRDNLFELPLPLPPDSIYRDLDLDPSATSEEVGWAVKTRNDERRAEKARLDKEIKKTTEKVPGLQDALDAYKKTQDSGNTDEKGLQRMAEFENRALNFDPSFQENRR